MFSVNISKLRETSKYLLLKLIDVSETVNLGLFITFGALIDKGIDTTHLYPYYNKLISAI